MNRRIEWIDLAKGIAIILVVYGHTTLPNCVSKVIYSFHMPLFFILSGLLFNPDKINSPRLFLLGKIRTIVIPYIFFLFIDIIYRIIWNIDIDWHCIYLGRIENAYWFLQVFFLTVVWECLIIKYTKWYISFLLTLSVYCISFYLSIKNIHLPYRLEVIGLASVFWYTGYVLRVYILRRSWKNICSISGLFVTIFVAQILPRFDMNSNHHGIVILNYMLACFASISIIMLSKNICALSNMVVAKKALLWCGVNSIIIMGLSQPVNCTVKYILIDLEMPHIILFGLQHVVLWSLLIISTYILNKYIPFVIGKSK